MKQLIIIGIFFWTAGCIASTDLTSQTIILTIMVGILALMWQRECYKK